MKRILLCIFTFSILSSCNKIKSDKIESENVIIKKNEAQKEEKKQDSILNYWEIILDTITEQKEFKNIGINKLELKTFSLNDSLIVRNLGKVENQIYIDYSHTMVTDIKLFTESNFDTKRIDKTKFKKILDPEFYADCNLFSTKIENIVGNIIFLTSDLNIPDTDNQWRVWYSIKIKNNKLENIEITKTDYVGM
ncbi:MAG: hypothetical protein L6Q46_05295 [Flavobacterium sp.]|uniref:hypothetical protein n=1 Tax=Flavobacterium sp. TaxID=239 RepID=UPI0025C16E77|nr:hypothetical protein [Flavobacterium sp.]MCK6607706.1 hypothetical protein [Flavobacterium sp.]